MTTGYKEVNQNENSYPDPPEYDEINKNENINTQELCAKIYTNQPTTIIMQPVRAYFNL